MKKGSVYKALLVIKALVEEPKGKGIRTLAKELDLPPSTVHRILQELVDNRFAEIKEGIYWLGPEFYYLTYLVRQHNPLYIQAIPIIKELAKECGETVALGQFFPSQNTLTFIATVESAHPIRHVLDIGQKEVLYAGATGKAVLAFLPVDIQNRILEECVNEKDVLGIPLDSKKIRKELSVIRQIGYAITYQEVLQGAYGFAAPVLGPNKDVLGVIGVTIPESRVDLSIKSSIGELVLQYSNKISLALGVDG